jgi:hypothetical protein
VRIVGEQSMMFATLWGMPAHFVKLNMRWNCCKTVPRLLTNDQKQRQLEVSMELKEQVSNDPHFLFKVVTCDQSWIYGYDTEAKWQSS